MDFLSSQNCRNIYYYLAHLLFLFAPRLVLVLNGIATYKGHVVRSYYANVNLLFTFSPLHLIVYHLQICRIPLVVQGPLVGNPFSQDKWIRVYNLFTFSPCWIINILVVSAVSFCWQESIRINNLVFS